MDMCEIRRIIQQEEMAFPKAFTSYAERAYGMLFYNTNNTESNDSNHAVLYPDNITDLCSVLHDITGFYTRMGLGSSFSIYQPFVADYFLLNADALHACGYDYTLYPDSRIMLLTAENTIRMPKRLNIRRITQWDEGIDSDVLHCVANKQHFKEGIRRSMHERYHLFIGYLGGEAVSLLSFHVSPLGVTRFDEMGTADKYQNQGFAREMNGFAADFVREHNLPVAYQWPAHPTSQRITEAAGFRVAFTLPVGSAALAK